MPPPRPGTRWVTDFFSYETTKSVVVKSWVVGAINRGVQLLILTYFIGWVFLHEKAYQVRDTVIESSVVTKVKGIGHYAGRVLDTADYVTPHQVRGLRAPGSLPCLSFPSRMARGAARVTVTYPPGHLGVRGGHQADPDGEPGAGRLPGERSRVPLHGRPRLPGEEPRHGQRGADRALRPLQRDPAHLRDPGLVPAGGGHRRRPRHAGGRKLHPLHQEQHPLPALRLREVSGTGDAGTGRGAMSPPARLADGRVPPCPPRANLPPPGSGGELGRCRFHPERQPLCPILRLGDVVRLAGQDFPTLAATGGVLGIKIGWVCDLDHAWERCLPRYSFTRLDGLARTPAPGYNFRHARYYRWQDGTERRTLTKAFGIRFDVLVYGNVRAGLGAFPRTLEGPWRVGTPLQRVSLHSQAGKFGIVPTLINTVAAFTSIGVGTVLCDIILLNFLKGAEHYKARKFEEVPEAGVPAPPTSPTACPPGALGGCSRDKQSTDSGTFSLGL
ncbi:P2X purinoceptor 3 isoform X2 [Calonectris borealis]|uniref:P2X purinoceptor 3 isoform X2 n=1 Tax=Calonectris borealis TaxID=1323832 RepID=UPI003F4C60F1